MSGFNESGDRQSDVVSESEDDTGSTHKKKLKDEKPQKNKSSKVVKSKENIMYAFTKSRNSQSDVVSESEDDRGITPKKKLKDEQPKKNKSSKVVKESNRNVLPSSSEDDMVTDSRNAEKNSKKMDYNEEDYSYRKSWRTKISKRISEISSEDNSDSSDNDRREPLKRKVLSKSTKTNRSSKKIIRKLPSLLDEEKYSESSSDMELLTPKSDNNSIGSVDDERLPSDDEHQPYLDHHGHMVLPPLMQQFIEGQEGKSFTGWDRAADFQMLNLLKVMPKAEFACNKWSWVASQMENYTFSNREISNHVRISYHVYSTHLTC